MARARARMETLKGHSSTPWQSTILHIGKHLQIYLFRIINLNILKQKSSDGGGDGGGGGETGGCDGGGGRGGCCTSLINITFLHLSLAL